MLNRYSQSLTITKTGSVGRTENTQPDLIVPQASEVEFIELIRRQAVEALMVPECRLNQAGFRNLGPSGPKK